MKAVNRRAFTLVELLTVLAIIGLLLSILTPPLSRAREMARRGLCLTNLREIGHGCITYAIGSNGHFPYKGDPLPGFNAIGDAWDWDGVAANTYSGAAAYTFVPKSNTRHLWKLVQMQIADPKTFVCPSDGEGGEQFNPPSLKPINQTHSSISDVQNRSQFSYAFQYQGPALPKSGNATKRDGWATATRDDPKMVVLADTSPSFRARNLSAIASADDHTFDFATETTWVEGAKYMTAMNNLKTSGNITWNTSTAKATYTMASTEDMQYINSPNHRGDGQNIIRLDGSGDFAADPWAGAYMDNIWTVQDPTEYQQATPNANNILKARMLGLYDAAVGTFEADLLKAWVLEKQSKTQYPDSFLVP